MKVLLSLMALCITLGLCHGACFLARNTVAFVDGKMMLPDGCTDLYDGTKHPFGDVWNSSRCMRCSCGRTEMQCCTRGVEVREGCRSILDMETCSYKFYKIDDPTTPCNF
nr:small serum protein 5-like [Pogona vitticeps]